MTTPRAQATSTTPTVAATTTTATRTATTANPAPALTAEQINRQDRPSAALLRRQRAVSAARPMLSALPITAHGVTISIGGLAADGHTAILELRSRRSQAHVLAVYSSQLHRYADSGQSYQPRISR
jgi:hypothetical protein